LDGYLTHQATIAASAAGLGGVDVPSAGELTAQMFLGRRARRKELVAEADAIAAVEYADSPLAFVAVDLLEIDGTTLLDVPLLERKRLLESIVVQGELLRIGAYVRPPVDAWLGTWRSLGFFDVAYKAANGRYTPGRPSETWATARIPKP
jgi:bifunctional non-homologous end joining protein LigD